MQTDYNLIIGIAGVIIGAILGAVFTWWSISQSRRIAKESGAFKRADPSIYFLRKDLLKNPIESTNWVLLCPKDAALTVYSLSFQVANEGDATMDSPIFTIQGSIDCIKDVPEDTYKFECVPGVMKDSIKRSIVNLGNFNQISYMLPYIGNKSAVELTDAFCFKNTLSIPVTSEAVSKDGVKLKFTFEYSYAYILSLGLLTKDYPSVKCDLNMMCLPADTIDEAKDMLAREFSKKPSDEKRYYAFLHFGIDGKIKNKNEYIYSMKKYSEKGFNMAIYYM